MEKNLSLKHSNHTLVKVDYDELVFIRRNAPPRFVGIVTASLNNDGYDLNRVQVHKELNSLKEDYNELIVNRARMLLKAITSKEYQPASESAQ